jgi:hypothetical protein
MGSLREEPRYILGNGISYQLSNGSKGLNAKILKELAERVE